MCYAYLSDVSSAMSDHHAAGSEFRESLWFTRGWTLQELLAPVSMIFFDAQWAELGTRLSLQPLLGSITGISNIAEWRKACVAQKLSWASNRQTTRIEDRAYCLMGIFDVNMPLLYGEGEKAFIRLQLEILKQSDDDSIFAWTSYPKLHRADTVGLLAGSVTGFRNSGAVERRTFMPQRPYSMTNQGLRKEFHFVHTPAS